ncbi:MAG: response regulator [Firmicutes bacterium]|nr:response regulator [Bacillota bacterium]
MDNSIINLINKAAIKIFGSTTLIDIANDQVMIFDCKNAGIQAEKNTYEDYYEKLKKIIHPDYLNKYFEAISLNFLQNSTSDYECIKYLKLSSNLSYDSYIDIIKLMENDQVLVLSFKCNLTNEKVEPKNDDVSLITADLVWDIESVIDHMKADDFETKNAVKYISELLNDVKQHGDVLKKYQEKVTVEVNKTYESLLIVDDDSLTRNIFKKIFEKDFNIIEAKNGAEAVDILENKFLQKSDEENIVGMFLDLKMPVMDGFGVLDYLKDKRIINRIPVIIISADDAKETKESVYTYDIADMIEKPFNYELIKKRIGNMIRMYAKSNALNELIRVQERELKEILAQYTKSYFEDYQYINEVSSKYLKGLLEKYASISDLNIDVSQIIAAARYYDIALNFVPRKYLERINNLNAEEKKVVLNYPNLGEKIIKYVTESQSDSFVKYAVTIAKMHNEKYDGTGFPLGAKEEAIPYYVYLVNMALECANLEIKNTPKENIYNIIITKSGTKYHPRTIEAFKLLFEELR